MGQVLKIESDEAFTLATELAALTGESLEKVVVESVRKRLATEQDRRARVARVLELAAEMRELMQDPLPSPDTNHLFDYLYDDGRDH